MYLCKTIGMGQIFHLRFIIIFLCCHTKGKFYYSQERKVVYVTLGEEYMEMGKLDASLDP